MRVPLQTPVTCELGARRVHGVSWNLSQGGIQIEASSLQQGETVHLSFRLPASDTEIEAVGVVVWAREERQGIQFTDVNARSQEFIRDFIVEVEKPDL